MPGMPGAGMRGGAQLSALKSFAKHKLNLFQGGALSCAQCVNFAAARQHFCRGGTRLATAAADLQRLAAVVNAIAVVLSLKVARVPVTNL